MELLRATCAALIVGAAVAAAVDSGPTEMASSVGLDDVGVVAPADEPAHTYMGTKRCRSCHTKHYESWLDHSTGRSWEALKPGFGKDAKTAAGLDVDRDYTSDSRCLPCHTVGFARPGGYVIPDPEDRKTQRAAAAREGVGCEACHGPGSGFVAVMKEVRRTRRTYKQSELHAAGLRKIGPDVCNACHNENAICVADSSTGEGGAKALSVENVDSLSAHETFPLQQRER